MNLPILPIALLAVGAYALYQLSKKGGANGATARTSKDAADITANDPPAEGQQGALSEAQAEAVAEASTVDEGHSTVDA